MKVVKFIPASQDVNKLLEIPKPASRFIPEWFKKSSKYINSDKLIVNDYATNIGLKSCSSYLDSFINGYIVQLWQDIYVSVEEDTINLSWTNIPDPVIIRHPKQGIEVPRPHGFHHQMFNWNLQWGVKLPSGYSSLMTHPLNRDDLPYRTLSGIVDSDKYIGEGKVPFFIKEGFEGIIPAGSPILQIIPIKREKWNSEKSENLIEERDRQQWSLRSKITGYYKSNFRSSKIFK